MTFTPTPASSKPDTEELQKHFAHTFGQPVLLGKIGQKKQAPALKVGVVFSGGQAAGGHNVITGLFDALKVLNTKSQLFGFLEGPSGIVEGKSRELTAEILDGYRNRGGFDLIGSGRIKIETEEQLAAALKVMQRDQIDALVVIGGDDSNTNAAILAEYFETHGCKTRVIGVPKTIDGDLRNEFVQTPFGFDTACKVYAELIGNIAKDLLSAKKYTHFIKLMGRSASHITLECALATQPNFSLIGEECASKGLTLQKLTSEIADCICKRAELGKNYGVILIPEGLVEFLPDMKLLLSELSTQSAASPEVAVEKLTPASKSCYLALPESIQKQLLLERDPHGNVQLSLIETELLLIALVKKELASRKEQGKYKGKFSPLHHFFGYEGRSALPSNFDATYCYSLGYAAALLLSSGHTSYMAAIQNLKAPIEQWQPVGVPLTMLMCMEKRHGKQKPVIEKALVDLNGPAFSYFAKERMKWMEGDLYVSPGPIQFFGDHSLTDSLPLSLTL